MKIYKIAQNNNIEHIQVFVQRLQHFNSSIKNLKMGYVRGLLFVQKNPNLLKEPKSEMESVLKILHIINSHIDIKTIQKMFYSIISDYSIIYREITNQIKINGTDQGATLSLDSISTMSKLENLIQRINNIIGLIIGEFELNADGLQPYQQATQDEIEREFGIKF